MGDIQGTNKNVVPQESIEEIEPGTNRGKLSIGSESFMSADNPKEKESFECKMIDSDTRHVFLTYNNNKYFWVDKLTRNNFLILAPPPCVDLMGDISGIIFLPQELIEQIVSRTSPLDACEKLSIVSRSFWSAAKSDNVWESFLPAELISRAVSQWMHYHPCKKIDSDTLQAFPTNKDLYVFLLDNPLIIDDDAMYFWLDLLSENKCFLNLSPPPLSAMVLKSLSPRWLLSHNTVHTHVDLMGDVLCMNALPQELIEEIVSRTSPLDVCGNLSIVSRSFRSAAKSDHVWERFLPADLISRRAVSDDSHDWISVEDPWKKIDSDTLQAFPTKKDLYLFLSDNPLIIDDGAMYFWLHKLSGNKCFYILPETLSIPEPDGWRGPYSHEGASGPFEIYGKISTSLLSPNTAYTAYLLFDFTRAHFFEGFEKEPLKTCVWIDGDCERGNRIVYIPSLPSIKFPCRTRGENPLLTPPQYPRCRDDNWYELELGDYFNKEGGDNRELHMSLSEVKSGIARGGIDFKGMEIRPKICKGAPFKERATLI